MNQRERFLAYMQFQPVDRVPLMDMGTWPETIERWHHEGLPKWVTDLHTLGDHLQLDVSFNCNWLPINDQIYPYFDSEVLEETESEQIVRDAMGVTYRTRKHFRTIPQYLRFPVENEADYDALLPRLNFADPGRYAEDFDEDLRNRRQRGEIVGLNFQGLFGFPRSLMGVENWCLAFYEQPHLARRIIGDRVTCARQLLTRVLATGALDFVQIWEDMAYKGGPLISPRMVREFMLPAYSEIIGILRAGGVKIIMVDSDGFMLDLAPIWLEAGVNGVHPCEMAAGSDPLIVRKRHPRCAIIAGMDKRLIASGREGIDAELRRVQPLWEDGAYIPMLDHFVPPDVSWADFCYYVERRRELLNHPVKGK